MNNKKRALDASAKLAYAEVTIFTENVELHTKGVAMWRGNPQLYLSLLLQSVEPL